jgi:hypothetical protein
MLLKLLVSLSNELGMAYTLTLFFLKGFSMAYVTPKKLDENLSALNWLSLENDFFNY